MKPDFTQRKGAEPMTVSERDRTILRDLAKRVAEIAAMPEQAEKARLWTACNDLKPERPMIYADQFWRDADRAWLALACEDAALHGFEAALRRRIIRHEHIHDDCPIRNTFDVCIQATESGYDDYGLKLETTSTGREGGAYHIEPVIRTEEDLEKLHFRPIRLLPKETDLEAERAHDLFGDVLEVRRKGRTGWRYGLTRVLIHMRGLDQMMFDMCENPDMMHHLMTFLRDDYMREIDVYEEAGEVSLNNEPDNGCGSGGLAPTDDLPGEDLDGDKPSVRHCFCWGESQETVGVGPGHFDEFVLAYQLPLLERFGLVDYGCCEALDHKLDLLIEKVPKLRWVSVSPWANRALAAEKLGGNYVYVYKPNPSRICAETPDWEAAERDIRETVEIARGCPMHIVMKDVQTLCGEAERITRWTDMAARIVRETT